MRPIPAKLSTRCLLCDEQIELGEDIVKIEDDSWVHHQCAIDEGVDE